MKNKVIIIGSKGTLGQALVKVFSKSYLVFPWDKEDCNILTPDGLTKIEQEKPDLIINATAFNAVDKIETEEDSRKLGYLLNADAPRNLAQIAYKLGATFIHYSTNYVFDGNNKAGYTEHDTPSPINEYGKSKLAGEQAVTEIGGNFYIIRLSRLFGIRGTGETSKRTFVEIMQSEIEKTELTVGNTEISCLTYAPDLAKLSREIFEQKMPYGIYHGVNSGACTWYDWAVEIFKDLAKGPKVIPVESMTPKATKHPTYGILLNTKLPPQRSWQEALKDFLNHANN